MKSDYLPTDESQLTVWFTNFSDKFAGYAAGLGLAADAPSVQADNAMLQYLIAKYKRGFETSRSTVTGFANGMLDGGIAAPSAILPFPAAPTGAPPMVEPNIIGRTRALVKRIKSAPGYTEDIGKSLGVVAGGEEAELTAPDLTVKPLAGRILEIKWRKGTASAIEIFVDFGADYPSEGRVLTEPDAKMTVSGATGSGPLSIKVKGIYQRKGERVGEFGPTYSTLLLP